ncbi:GNAT family N-acetyltransferase [Niabella yanshanensis]|uniref:GNAT family N-acetyltransferase n=1 Tax=Niabella yanshanensis TaxID=577386 RepID=A0ABZ0W862_9BACT|nr:GNAT family N-acetyltransferase [Niabella yanshanensis]WQD38788.1 GNAT family N-acetyltransferase [Niabella yanshanensis]
MEVIVKELDGKGYAMARENGKRAGMMTYSIAGEALIIVDHTEVEPDFNGKGVGQQMLYKIVDMAREKQIKIIPLCPFAAAMFKRTDNIKDVLKG